MGTVSENQASEYNKAKNRQGREDLGGGERVSEHCCADAQRAALRPEQQTCTCYWMSHSPSQLAAAAGFSGPVKAGVAQRKSWECVWMPSFVRQQKPRGPRAHFTLLLPPLVPLCHESALNRGRESLGRRISVSTFFQLQSANAGRGSSVSASPLSANLDSAAGKNRECSLPSHPALLCSAISNHVFPRGRGR